MRRSTHNVLGPAQLFTIQRKSRTRSIEKKVPIRVPVRGIYSRVNSVNYMVRNAEPRRVDNNLLLTQHNRKPNVRVYLMFFFFSFFFARWQFFKYNRKRYSTNKVKNLKTYVVYTLNVPMRFRKRLCGIRWDEIHYETR